MIGSTLSHYRVIEKLGQGGMGIVYRAEDTKLDRTVAIKVLPSAALASKDDRERFYREARSAAALHHPNIATVFEIDEAVPSDAPHGTQPSLFIAMEFIDGRSLEEEIKNKPLKIERVKTLAIQIARALEAAHEKNIVHRDIKTANVMLTAKGEAKVLDFGLAKTNQSSMLTRLGSTLGTVAYMSPEQARGEEVDKRTDLWALGVVIHEMVSGQHPFAGDYEQAVVYSIMNEDPEPLTAVRTGVPMQLEWIVNKCLAKKAEDRYQSAADLIVDLRNIDASKGSGARRSTSPSGSVTASPKAETSPRLESKYNWPLLAAALGIGVLATFGILSLSQSPPEKPPMAVVEISLPGLRLPRFPTLSPTRTYLAIQARDARGRYGIYLRTMATGDIQYIQVSENVGDREFGFSPDGSKLAFNAESNDGLFIVVVPAGIPEQITDFGRFAFWFDNETIVMSDDKIGGGELYQVSIDGSTPEKLIVADPKRQERYGNVLKSNIPGTDFAFGHQIVRVSGGNIDYTINPNLFALNQKTGELEIIESNAINPNYVKGGFLMYQLQGDDGRLLVRPVDKKTGQFSGQPKDALPREMPMNWGEYSVSPEGDLLYINRTGFFGMETAMWLVDLETKEISAFNFIVPADSPPHSPEFSNDNNAFVYQVSPQGHGGQIFYYDLTTGANHQYSFDGKQADPAFDRTGENIYFTRGTGENRADIYKIPADNSALPERVFEDAVLPDLSPDGKWMAVTGTPPTWSVNLLLVNLEDDGVSVMDSSSNFPSFVHFSPDSRYVVYQKSVPGTGGGLMVKSVNGLEAYRLPGITGNFPRWSNNGAFIYYATTSGIDRLPVRTQPTFSVLGPPESILATTDIVDFDVSSDMNRILVSATSVALATKISEEAPRIVWLQNWSDYLKREFVR